MDENRVEVSWPELTRARRALVVVDVVESVRLMQAHEADVIDRWRRFVNEVRTQVLPPHGGRLVKSLGDGMLLEFESVPSAVAAALEVQRRIVPYNAGREASAAMHLRLGAHVAEVVVDQLDVYGAGVNMAARLATLAGPQQIVVSAAVRDQLVSGFDADVEDLGDCFLKHLEEPVRAYRLSPPEDMKIDAPVAPVNALRPVLAIIPFDTPDSEGMQAHLGDAVADELIAVLSRSPELTVVSRLSTTLLRGRDDALACLRSHVHADYALSGTLHLAGDRLRLLVELTEVRSAQVVWANRVQGSALGVFRGDEALIGDLAHQVCDSLARRQVERARLQPMATLESYCLLMAAVALLHGASAADFERARAMLEHLIEREPRHPAAHAWLAKWYVLRVQQGWSPDMGKDARLASDSTRRALDADPRLPLSLAIDGFVHCNLLKDLEGAESRYRLALSESPNEPLAWLFLGTVHAFRGEGSEAIQAATRALELSPLDPTRYFFESLTATAALAAGQYERTIEFAKRSLRLHRTHTSTLRAMAIAQVQLGRMDEARATVRDLLVLEPRLTIRGYLARSPSSGFSTGRLWSESLAAAGVPAA